MRALALTLTLLLSAVVVAPVSAQPAPDALAPLRERLERLRARRPENVPEGALTTVEFLLWLSRDLEGRFADKAPLYRRRAERYLTALEQGRDPLPEERGRIVNRGYRSAASTVLQGYAVYVPDDYDPNRAYPLYVALHGGSSNGNLFLGVVLGNNMDWLTYDQHLWDEYTARYTPDWIVVAPTGFGQMLWRWMAEQDVLDVVADVQRHYRVDPNHVVLGGLSNGGLGTYAVGSRHAYRFSSVMAMAGAPSWLMYAPCQCNGLDRANVERWSGIHLIENTVNTDWRSYHGRVDPGPMRPAFVQQYEERARALSLPLRMTWYETGHDILYLCHERGNVYTRLDPVVRNPRPREVRLVTGDYRAPRQHWLTVTRIPDYPRLATLRGAVDGARLTITTENVDAFEVDLRDVPFEGGRATVVVDGSTAFEGELASVGHVMSLVREGAGFRVGHPEAPADGLEKRPGLSGPITDAYYGRMVHVYGTADAAATEPLRQAAERGARGWVLWSWHLRQEVVRDTEVTDAMMRDATVVLYGTAASNTVLARMADRLPIRVEGDAIKVGEQVYRSPDVGARFIYPNPLAEGRYVIVQTGVTPAAVARGNALPEFLPDWFVYDRASLKTGRAQSRHAGPNARAVASGWFDARWQLRAPSAARTEAGSSIHGATVRTTDAHAMDWLVPTEDHPLEGDDSRPTRETDTHDPGTLPVPPTPAMPTSTRFLAAAGTQEGDAAREIARRVRTFHNYRGTIRGAVWATDESRTFGIRPAAECLAELDRLGVPYRRATSFRAPIVATPVEVSGEVAGVHFGMAAAGRRFIVSCELAARLPRVAEVLRPLGIVRVGVVSAYRDNPYTSFHTMGLALDIGSFGTADGRTLRVLGHFARTPNHRTCEAPEPTNPNARDLLRIACALHAAHLMNSVLTPNYNVGHHDHFHVDIRPEDPRFFVR